MLNSKKIIRPFVLTKDPLVQRILERFAKRSENGIKKYGKTMVDATKSIDEWIDDHHCSECLYM